MTPTNTTAGVAVCSHNNTAGGNYTYTVALLLGTDVVEKCTSAVAPVVCPFSGLEEGSEAYRVVCYANSTGSPVPPEQEKPLDLV